MLSRYTLCGVVTLLALASCCTTSSIRKEPSLTQTTFSRCVGLEPVSLNDDTIVRCKLTMWAKVPARVLEDGKISIQIPKDGEVHELPCVVNSPWVGQISKTLIAKCVENDVWVYWTSPKVHKVQNFNSSAFVHVSGKMTEYVIRTRGTNSTWGVPPGPELEFLPMVKDWIEEGFVPNSKPSD